jgi:hypothetical protein
MNCTVRRVVQFLNTNGLLIPDPARAIDPHHAAVQRMVADLPTHLAPEVATHGFRYYEAKDTSRRNVMRWQIRQYVGYALATLTHWGSRLTACAVSPLKTSGSPSRTPGHQLAAVIISGTQARTADFSRSHASAFGLPALSRFPFRCPTTDCAFC